MDLRIFPNGSFKILDKQEYKYHKKKMHYSKDLDIVVNNALSELITSYQRGDIMFDLKRNLLYGKKYAKLKDSSN